jgi:hypothetical protein
VCESDVCVSGVFVRCESVVCVCMCVVCLCVCLCACVVCVCVFVMCVCVSAVNPIQDFGHVGLELHH